MNSWSFKRVAALLLGVVFTLGVTLSALEAGGMQMSMDTPVMTSMPGQDSCKVCGPLSGGGLSQSACESICLTSAVAIIPLAPPIVAYVPVSLPLREYPLLRGQFSPPDPHPPKFNDL